MNLFLTKIIITQTLGKDETMRKYLQLPIFLLGLSIMFSGCAENDPYRNTKIGSAIGGVVGAGAGAAIDKKKRARGAAIGAAVGILAGGGVGLYMDKQAKDIEKALAEELAQHDVELRKLPDNGLEVDLKGESTFATNSTTVKPGFQTALTKLGNVLTQYDSTIVHVIGHTDAQGSDTYNQELSEKRASSVASHLNTSGVHLTRLHAEGRGEAQPRANNGTAEGRSLNRRVEIYLKPVVEGQEAEALKTPE